MHSELLQTTEEIAILKRKPQVQVLKNWYVFYTSPRAEKSVYYELVKRNYEAFLPIKKTLRLWKNRQKKWVDEVLFPSYIFVNTGQGELYNIARITKVVTYICCGGIPSIIASNEIEGIKKMLILDQDISVETNFSKGERVRIVYGPLAGHEGILVKQKGKSRFGIQLKEINHTVFIDVCVSMLEKVKTKKFISDEGVGM